MKLAEAVEVVFRELDPSRQRVLEALFFAPAHSASAGQLKILLGFSAVVQVNAAVGYTGRRVREVFGAHPDGLVDGTYEWWHVIATGEQTKNKGFVWRLRDEVVAALAASRLSASAIAMPNEVHESEALFEGAVQRVMVNAYERNPVARARCIEAHGYRCAICEFDFGTVYGPAMEGFIHVHHVRTLASIGAEYEIDPVSDLRPVCPNCHAVIHRVVPPRSLEEVKAMLNGTPSG